MRCLKSNVTQSYILPLCIAACFWYNSGTVCLLSMYHTLVHCTLYKCRSQVEFGPNVSYIHRWWSQGNGVFKKPFISGRSENLDVKIWGLEGLQALGWAEASSGNIIPKIYLLQNSFSWKSQIPISLAVDEEHMSSPNFCLHTVAFWLKHFF